MRIAVLGATVFAGLVIASLGSLAWPSLGFAQRPVPYPGGGSNGLITLTTPAGEQNQQQQIVVIDPELRVMSVYHVRLSTGEIVLKSVRNIHWDLQMVDFNGSNPLPRDVRSIVEQK